MRIGSAHTRSGYSLAESGRAITPRARQPLPTQVGPLPASHSHLLHVSQRMAARAALRVGFGVCCLFTVCCSRPQRRLPAARGVPLANASYHTRAEERTQMESELIHRSAQGDHASSDCNSDGRPQHTAEFHPPSHKNAAYEKTISRVTRVDRTTRQPCMTFILMLNALSAHPIAHLIIPLFTQLHAHAFCISQRRPCLCPCAFVRSHSRHCT